MPDPRPAGNGSAARRWPARGPQDSLRAALCHIERVDPGVPVMRSPPAAAGESWVGVLELAGLKDRAPGGWPPVQLARHRRPLARDAETPAVRKRRTSRAW